MTPPVVMPDYSWIINWVIISLSATSLRFTYKKLKSLGWFTKKKDKSFDEWATGKKIDTKGDTFESIYSIFDQQQFIKRKQALHSARVFAAAAAWNKQPHLKEDTHVCGFISPDVWECRCGQRKCATYSNHFGTLDTAPEHPTPNRRAAIEHARRK